MIVIRANDLYIGQNSRADPSTFVKLSCQEFKTQTKTIRRSSARLGKTQSTCEIATKSDRAVLTPESSVQSMILSQMQR